MALSKDEHESLVALLTDAPEADTEHIEEALKAGLTRDDVEWNQRLGRPWLYKGSGKAETEARVAYYTANGIEQETAEAYVATDARDAKR